ncbi:aminodeoxychorismate lyase [Rossellomorea aquimaris]|uniref:4-amino-4-deoxychorismate lyase n=1 Tax=Rossellomorea aquimaris TaxID=189382 RepID=A0A1J6W238_9BACI|nr:aminodeoxychorismate lyase [Rossellomorea aquimaris]OIU71645.1 4-amino-4-deoxychorismate lyase [Rossellomorea aquimaris]
MYIYSSGKIVHQSEAAISPFDHGYLYGLGVFETFRTYGGHPFLFGNHLARLKNGLDALNIKADLGEAEMKQVVTSLLRKNGLEDAYCRLNVSGGPGEIGLQTAPYVDPTVILFQKELPPSVPLREKEGIILKLRRSTPEIKERLKSHHYLNNLAAKREIGPAPDKEGIFLTGDGYLCEGITSNIFWLKEGELFTPAVETGLLNGITRQFILALAEKLKLPVREGFYQESDLEGASEVFLTNSVQEIVPVRKIGDQTYRGRDGRYVRLLHEHYQEYVPYLNSIEDMKEGNTHDKND